jgi:hypothetical protein
MWAAQWLMWLVAGPLTGRADFDSRVIHKRFVTDQIGTGMYLYPKPRFYPVPTIPLMLHIHISFTYYRGYAGPSCRAI